MSETGDWFREMRDDYNKTATLWFGKYKGVPMSEIPQQYLMWLRKQPFYKKFNRSLKRAICHNCPQREVKLSEAAEYAIAMAKSAKQLPEN